jgi:hypothetical protein
MQALGSLPLESQQDDDEQDQQDQEKNATTDVHLRPPFASNSFTSPVIPTTPGL